MGPPPPPYMKGGHMSDFSDSKGSTKGKGKGKMGKKMKGKGSGGPPNGGQPLSFPSPPSVGGGSPPSLTGSDKYVQRIEPMEIETEGSHFSVVAEDPVNYGHSWGDQEPLNSYNNKIGQDFAVGSSDYPYPYNAYDVGANPSGSPQTRKKGSPTRAKFSITAVRQFSPRAMVQIFLTVLCLGTGIMGFIFAAFFDDTLNVDLMENQAGEIKSDIRPCMRSILSEQCGNTQDDQCWVKCCPPGYGCERNPLVGLYCQDGSNVCGNGEEKKRKWCEDFVDISGKCRTETCLQRDLARRMTKPVFFIAGMAVLLDLIDVTMFFSSPDAVVYKSMGNLGSSCLKFLAFGFMLGAETKEFMSALYDNKCYNEQGMTLVQTNGTYLVSFVVTIVVSGLLSLMLAPISAFWGGKLIGVPYVR